MNSLEAALQRYYVQLHAFVLMTNHVHLLLTPDDSQGISRVMQSVGRDYVRYVNKHYQRSGTLFNNIRQSLTHNYPLGGERFRAEIEHALGVRLGKCGPGRPEAERGEAN
jgi:hypothetical protein